MCVPPKNKEMGKAAGLNSSAAKSRKHIFDHLTADRDNTPQLCKNPGAGAFRLRQGSIARSNIVLVDSSCRGLDAIHPEYEPRRVGVRHAVAANVFCEAGHAAPRNLQWL